MSPDRPHSSGQALSLRAGQGRFSLEARVLPAGDDWLVLVIGGDKPHLGAVAAATPRPSLADPARTSATASVLSYVGHKEDHAAKHLSEALSAALGVKVVVAAGMHWDDIKPEEIILVGELVDELGAKLAAKLQNKQ